jgi:hypothetical protein
VGLVLGKIFSPLSVGTIDVAVDEEPSCMVEACQAALKKI